jgi:hypothetical protein
MNNELDELQTRLVDAQSNYRAVLARGRSTKVYLSEYAEAHERVLRAERDLGARTGDEYAVPLDLGFLPEAGVSAPLLLQNDFCAVLTFSAVTIGPDRSRGETGTALIDFDLCQWTSFGYPNDEALPGHPLYGHGLCAYGIFEVHNSHWVRRMLAQNKVSFPNARQWDVRHLLFSFHDSTFECLCRGIKTSSISQEPYSTIFERVSDRFKADNG